MTPLIVQRMLIQVSEPKWRNGRRAGLKIRSSQEGVGSSPTFGTRVSQFGPLIEPTVLQHLGLGRVNVGIDEIKRPPTVRRFWQVAANVAVWMAIATWQQGRRDEATSRSARADRFVCEQSLHGHSFLEFRAPPTVWPPSDWWRLLVACREDHALIFDANFPSDPFAR